MGIIPPAGHWGNNQPSLTSLLPATGCQPAHVDSRGWRTVRLANKNKGPACLLPCLSVQPLAPIQSRNTSAQWGAVVGCHRGHVQVPGWQVQSCPPSSTSPAGSQNSCVSVSCPHFKCPWRPCSFYSVQMFAASWNREECLVRWQLIWRISEKISEFLPYRRKPTCPVLASATRGGHSIMKERNTGQFLNTRHQSFLPLLIV